ncbi:MAG: segregation/condensation protein A [Lachnospiraceae bacterium]|nr:segregation/condensation protein A [Lachnospiraceae bacterium]
MGISVKLQAFEGPLDLLLHLIDKNKVNIYDIPIVEITEQYLAYVNQMDHQDLDVVSEFLVMAATLLDIKSKMLLPKEINEDGEEEDPRDELVQKLLEYKMYKYMSYELRDRELDAERNMYKGPTIPKEVAKYEQPVDLDELLSGVTLIKLNEIFKQVMKRKEDKIDPIRSKFRNIEKEEVSLPDKINFIRDYVKDKKTFSFKKLLESQHSKMHVIVSFLAILELMKMGEIVIEQKEIFDDIIVSLKPVRVSMSS